MAAADARIRAFAAIEIDARVREAVGELVQRLRAIPHRAAWVRSENLHITLRFLGALERSRVDEYSALLHEQIAAEAPFEAAVRGIGTFSNKGRPSVVWTRLETESSVLLRLYEAAEVSARAIGLSAEKRAFTPHLTLGRPMRESYRVDFDPFLNPERDFDAGVFTVDAVSLFSSELTPHGARYTRLHRLNLDGLSRARGV